MLRPLLAALLCLSAVSRAQSLPLALRMPAPATERVDWALERAVHAEMSLPEAPVFRQSGYAEGGTSGGTHILIGTALMIGSFWLLMGVNDEDNFYNAAMPIVAPAAFFGGAIEVGYGVYKVAKNWNSGFH